MQENIKEYGVFNGKPTIPRFNREEKRQYVKNLRGNKDAKMCPHCLKKTLRITDDNCNVICELCGKIVKENAE